jgi:hypothetical protein
MNILLGLTQQLTGFARQLFLFFRVISIFMRTKIKVFGAE